MQVVVLRSKRYKKLQKPRDIRLGASARAQSDLPSRMSFLQNQEHEHLSTYRRTIAKFVRDLWPFEVLYAVFPGLVSLRSHT